MTCPNCNETLIMSDRQGIEIDYCPKCRGVWLDRGELDKIVERSAAYSSDAERKQYEEEQNRHYPQGGQYNSPYHRPKKKKGFLSDFFDFD